MTERSRNNVAVAPRSEWVYDWTDCPRGAKMLLLTDSGIAVLGYVGADTRGYLAWAPLPDRKKAPMPNKPDPLTEAWHALDAAIDAAEMSANIQIARDQRIAMARMLGFPPTMSVELWTTKNTAP